MPNNIFYKGNYVCVRDNNMQFILDEALEVVRSRIMTASDNEWLANVQKKWKIALLNVGNNCRDLSLDFLVKEKVSEEEIIQILKETKQNILSYGEIVPPLNQRRQLLASRYYNLDGAPTQRFADIIDSIIALIEN